MERKSRVSSVPANGEGISHLFGIYRSRTPDIKKGRSIRIKFIFVPVMLGSLLLVIFLTIMDITKSSSGSKPLPFARLPHLYSYDSSRNERQNYTNRNREKMINGQNDGTKAQINTGNTDNGSPTNGNLGYKEHNSLSFNRTRLHQIDNIVKQQNSDIIMGVNTSNSKENINHSYNTESPPYYDFTSDYIQGSINVNDKVDRTGRAYSVRRRFDDSEHTNRLQYNNRQILRTGRIMNKPHLSNTVSASSNIGSQYVDPPFTVTPMYGNTFAQLKPYQSVKNIKSIGDVLKYITKQNPSNVYITSTGVPENVAIKKAVKFSGTYRRPVEDESESNFGSHLSHRGFTGYDSYYSQSYGSFYDPFKNFKPVNPSEINRLISPGTNTDSVPSFSDKVYFTESSSIANFGSTTLRPFFGLDNVYNNQSRYHTSGSHTIAVFKPLAPTTSYGLGFTTQPPVGITKKKAKPFSVTLDIYPMTVEKDQVASGNSPQPSYQLAAPNKNIPPRHRWKPRPVGPLRGPRYRKPNVQSHGTSEPENHMVVHLNVFPNRSKKQPRQGRGHEINKAVLNTVIAGGTFGHRSFDGHNPVEDYTDYDDINFSLERNDTSKPETKEFYINSGNVTNGSEVDEKKTLSYDLLVEDDESRESISGQKENGNSEIHEDENSTTNRPNPDWQTTTEIVA